MQFEEVLESVYIGSLTNSRTNNHIYRNVTKDGIAILREIIEQNPTFEVTRPNKHDLFASVGHIKRMENIEIDFSIISIKDLFSYILYCLEIKESLDYNSFKDLLLFIKVLNKHGKFVNLHIFNASLLDDRDTSLLNSLIHLNLIGVGMQVYLEGDTVLRNGVTENGEELEHGVDHMDVSVETPRFIVKLKNASMERKAS